MNINNEQTPLLGNFLEEIDCNETYNNENYNNENYNNENEIINTYSSDSSSSYSGSSGYNGSNDSGENTCFICLDIMTEDEHRQYCECDGYISYVHYRCLNEWIDTSSRITCDFCKTNYNYEMKYSCDKFLNQKILFQKLLLRFILLVFVILCYFPIGPFYADGWVNQSILSLITAVILNENYKHIRLLYRNSFVLTLVSIP